MHFHRKLLCKAIALLTFTIAALQPSFAHLHAAQRAQELLNGGKESIMAQGQKLCAPAHQTVLEGHTMDASNPLAQKLYTSDFWDGVAGGLIIARTVPFYRNPPLNACSAEPMSQGAWQSIKHFLPVYVSPDIGKITSNLQKAHYGKAFWRGAELVLTARGAEEEWCHHPERHGKFIEHYFANATSTFITAGETFSSFVPHDVEAVNTLQAGAGLVLGFAGGQIFWVAADHFPMSTVMLISAIEVASRHELSNNTAAAVMATEVLPVVGKNSAWLYLMSHVGASPSGMHRALHVLELTEFIPEVIEAAGKYLSVYSSVFQGEMDSRMIIHHLGSSLQLGLWAPFVVHLCEKVITVHHAIMINAFTQSTGTKGADPVWQFSLEGIKKYGTQLHRTFLSKILHLGMAVHSIEEDWWHTLADSISDGAQSVQEASSSFISGASGFFAAVLPEWVHPYRQVATLFALDLAMATAGYYFSHYVITFALSALTAASALHLGAMAMLFVAYDLSTDKKETYASFSSAVGHVIKHYGLCWGGQQVAIFLKNKSLEFHTASHIVTGGLYLLPYVPSIVAKVVDTVTHEAPNVSKIIREAAGWVADKVLWCYESFLEAKLLL